MCSKVISGSMTKVTCSMTKEEIAPSILILLICWWKVDIRVSYIYFSIDLHKFCWVWTNNFTYRSKYNSQKKYVIEPEITLGIYHVEPSLLFTRMILGAYFGPGLGPIALDTVIETTIRELFWSLTVLKEGGRGLWEMPQGHFSRQNQ